MLLGEGMVCKVGPPGHLVDHQLRAQWLAVGLQLHAVVPSLFRPAWSSLVTTSLVWLLHARNKAGLKTFIMNHHGYLKILMAC